MLEINYENKFIFEFPEYYECDKGWFNSAELETKKFFIDFIKEGFTIIDAGAHIGMYSVLFSRLAKNGRIYCFEPTTTFDFLSCNTRYNGCENVCLVNKALSSKSGVFKDKIFRVWSQQIIDDKEFEFITIDDFVASQELKVDLIKIDVDSYDYEVLLGSERVLTEQSPLVIVELNHALEKRGYSIKNCIDYMNSIRYNILNVLDRENYVFEKWV